MEPGLVERACRWSMIRLKAPLRSSVAVAALMIAGGAVGMSDAGEATSECHMHRAKDVSFRERDSKDVLEMSIGTGPCYAATLTIVVRTELGEVLYCYVEKWKQHTAVNWQDPDLPDVAREFVEDSLSDAMDSAGSLPPYASIETKMFNATIEITESEYERLRSEDQPVLFHLTGYEVWQYVAYDPPARASKVIIVDGL